MTPPVDMLSLKGKPPLGSPANVAAVGTSQAICRISVELSWCSFLSLGSTRPDEPFKNLTLNPAVLTGTLCHTGLREDA